MNLARSIPISPVSERVISRSVLAAEDQLLLLCSRSTLNEDVRLQLRAVLAGTLDWDYILLAAVRHGVAPLLCRSLTQFAACVPAGPMERLRGMFEHSGRRNQRIFKTIAEVCAALGAARIEAMALKDGQLAWQVYPELGLRPMGDIDLLIRAGDRQRVTAIMKQLGFRALQRATYFDKYSWASGFERDGLLVDMQWNVCQREWDAHGDGNCDLEIERMWRNANPMDVYGQRVLAPKPEDMLFHLCLHLEGHRYCELILFVDIAEMLWFYGEKLDWAYLIGLARKYNSEASLYYVLRLTENLLDAPVPENVLRDLEPVYFPASICEALFGNLAGLHYSLDEIAALAGTPRPIMHRFETVVRRQAHGAMLLFREIDDLVQQFEHFGGGPVILDGAGSPRLVPDPLLEPFSPVKLFLIDRDLPRIQQALHALGFAERSGGEICVTRHVASRDPLLQDNPTTLTVRVSIRRELAEALRSGSGISRKESALRLMKRKLRGESCDASQVNAAVDVVALSPEELVVYLIQKLGADGHERLFHLCLVLEFMRAYGGALDWSKVGTLANRHGIAEQVAEGASILRAFLPAELLRAQDISRAGLPNVTAARLLEWARFDPTSWARHKAFKRGFYFIMVLLTTDNLRERLRYLWQSLVGGVLGRAVEEILGGAFQRRVMTEDVVFWLR